MGMYVCVCVCVCVIVYVKLLDYTNMWLMENYTYKSNIDKSLIEAVVLTYNFTCTYNTLE